MSPHKPEGTFRRRGESLARELDEFIQREAPDEQATAEMLHGAFEYFERHTRLARGRSPWPPEAGQVQPDMGSSN